MQLSIVTTLYRSSPHIAEFVDRARRAAERVATGHEIVLVNDGSPDDSLDVALGLLSTNERLRVIDLSRRYGHYEAMLAGLRHARGERTFLIDCDLEEPPEILEALWSELDRHPDCDLAVACQTSRTGSRVFAGGGHLYYRMLRAITGLDIPRDNLVARVMTRRYVDAIAAVRERPVSFDVLAARVGFRHREVATVKESSSVTTYPFMRRSALFLDSMLAYGHVASGVAALAAVIALAAGVLSLFAPESAFRIMVFAVLGAGLVAVALLCRCVELLLEDLRYRPATVKRVYPDE